MTESLAVHDALDLTAVDDLTTVLAGARADVDDPVALADRLFVVLDDDHGVAQVAQPRQRVDQAPVVALVQTDRRLVEHVQGAHQARPDLTGEPDPLRLAAGQRAGRTRQREVVEADVEQEPEPGVDLFGDPLGDQPIALAEFERREELGGLADRHLAHLGDVHVADGDRQRVRLEPRPATGAARHEPHVALVLLARPVALGAFVAALDPRDHALVLGRVLAAASVAVLVFDGQLAADAVQHDLLLLGGELAPRRVEVDVVHVGDRLEHAREVLGVGAAPRGDRPVVERRIGVGDDELGVDLERGAEAVALLARAVRRVEREVARRRLFVAVRRTSGTRGAG